MKPPRRRAPGVCLPLALAVVAPLAPVHAAWETVPDVKLSVENNDNLLRSSINEVDASRTFVDASVNFRNLTERGLLYVQPRVISDAYAESENGIYESNDVFLRAGGQHQRQTGAEGFRLTYSDQNTIRSEFAGVVPADPDVPPPPDVDSGRLDDAVLQQERLYAYGNVDFTLAERNLLRLETTRTDVHYPDRPTNSSYSDFDDTAIALRYAREFDQRNQFTVGVVGSQFNADRLDNRSSSTGLEFGYIRMLSQTWTLDLAVGTEDTDFRFTDPVTQTARASSETSTTFGAAFRRRGERTNVNFDLDRALSPNSSGFLDLRDTFRLYVTQEMTPRLNGYVGAIYAQTSTLGSNAFLNDRDYSRFEIGLEWAVTQRMYVNFAYNRLTQEFAGTNGTETDSNTFILGIGYRGLQRP